jgi:hypothetical protein
LALDSVSRLAGLLVQESRGLDGDRDHPGIGTLTTQIVSTRRTRGLSVAKTRKANTARKPPVPSDGHAEIDDWIRRVMPELRPIVEHLDERIRESIPGLQFAVKWRKAYYGLPDLGWIIEMVAYDVSVNVVFLGGADFDPPPPLGDTSRSRYVKVKTLEEAQGSDLTEWIEQAGRIPGWK